MSDNQKQPTQPVQPTHERKPLRLRLKEPIQFQALTDSTIEPGRSGVTALERAKDGVLVSVAGKTILIPFGAIGHIELA